MQQREKRRDSGFQADGQTCFGTGMNGSDCRLVSPTRDPRLYADELTPPTPLLYYIYTASRIKTYKSREPLWQN